MARVLISMPEQFLDEIDSVADSEHICTETKLETEKKLLLMPKY